MPALEQAVLHMGGMTGQRNRGLGNVIARLVFHLFPELGDLGLRRLRADEHAVAAGFVRGLDDEFFQVVQNVLQVGGFVRQIGVHIRNDRILVEVIFDHPRHEIIHDLVVGDAGADGVGQGHIAGTVGVHQARHAQHGVPAKNRRIQEIIVQPPVDHMDRLEPLGRAHENSGVAHHQVAPLHDFNAHLPGQVCVLKIG